MADAYLRHRQLYSSVSGALAVTATTDDTTLVTGKTGFTIYIQRVAFYVTTDAAQSISFEDSNGTPKAVCKVPTSPGVDTPWVFDFGPRGVPLTEAKNFVMNVSAVGLAGHCEWEGYSRLTAVLNA